MNYQLIDKEGNILAVGGSKNKKDAREKIMTSSKWQETVTVKYGRSEYSASDIYARF